MSVKVSIQIVTNEEAKEQGLMYANKAPLFSYAHEYYMVFDGIIIGWFDDTSTYYPAFKHLLELKPCPCCRCEAKWVDCYEGVIINCERCKMTTPFTNNRSEALRIWNTRVAIGGNDGNR